MLKKLLFTAFLGASFGAAAQSSFRPGYVLPLSGDTLRGEVDARGPQRNARQVGFRATPDGPVQRYLPAELWGYGLRKGRTYQTETIMLADSLQQQSFAQARVDTLQQPVFLETVVQGTLSLLYLEDRLSRSHYYLRTSTGQVIELVQGTEQVVGPKSLYDSGIESRHKSGNLAFYNKKNNNFRYTLQEATRQCIALQPAVVEVEFGLRPLTRLVERYNECVGDAPAPSLAVRTPPARLLLLAGAGSSRLALTDDRFFLNVRSNTTAGIQPVIGLGVAVPINRVSEKLMLQLQALYHAQQYETAVATDGVGTGQQYQYRADIRSVRVPLLLRYTWPSGKLRPFGQAGYGVSYLLKNESEVRRIPGPGQSPLPDEKWKPLMQGARLEAGIVGSIGVVKTTASQRNVALELRLENTNGFASSQGVSSGITRFFVLLSYDLTK
ncbi:porin family protein [Hymenobacter lapidiphilus]|uniref:PorT family protein n=1 Tax=Hymenobacter lapidiphilus TaxID=2608003 RepID=A0A7Y7PLA8_9BACT|nr:outer membrane beta-barrel protein [Hymenobacter lapidiphilus]NVO29919.1 hypothetical protein [Hymenobacter lapidiphilus]